MGGDLTERERRIIQMVTSLVVQRPALPMSKVWAEVGRTEGFARERARQTYAQAMRKLGLLEPPASQG